MLPTSSHTYYITLHNTNYTLEKELADPFDDCGQHVFVKYFHIKFTSILKCDTFNYKFLMSRIYGEYNKIFRCFAKNMPSCSIFSNSHVLNFPLSFSKSSMDTGCNYLSSQFCDCCLALNNSIHNFYLKVYLPEMTNPRKLVICSLLQRKGTGYACFLARALFVNHNEDSWEFLIHFLMKSYICTSFPYIKLVWKILNFILLTNQQVCSVDDLCILYIFLYFCMNITHNSEK